MLAAKSLIAVIYNDAKRRKVDAGRWYDFYTAQYFTNSADLDIDHIVPLSNAHRSGAAHWTEGQRKIFANDINNLLVVDDATNQSKSDKAPHEWLPPNKHYWCDYGKKWRAVKDKYGLRYEAEELRTLNELKKTCQ